MAMSKFKFFDPDPFTGKPITQADIDAQVASYGKENFGENDDDKRSPEQRAFDATQKVMQSSGLDRLEAMQSDDYTIGSGSSLRQTPRELGSERGRMRRAARALRRQGATGEANKMFAMAELAGMDEPNIVTEEERKRREAEKNQEAALIASNQEKSQQARDMANRLANKKRRGVVEEKDSNIAQYQGSVGL
tara:strand:- start:6370 stop:6945 length:576 start_codon:yes stop_codon:yes gene_type:complete